MLLALGSLTACLLLLSALELGLRLLGLADPAASELGALHDYSDVYGWAPRPGARFVSEGLSVSINARGYRGRLVVPRPVGVKRVVLLGDSVTFGSDVGDDQTFAALLDAPDQGLEVVNLAVQGYGLDQDLLKLEREGLAYAPQLVVLNICLDNDLADIGLPHFLYDGLHPKPYFRLEHGVLVLHTEHLARSSTRMRLAEALRRRSHLFTWLSQSVSAAPTGEKAVANGEHWTDRKNRALQDSQQVQALGVELIRHMRAQALGHGANFLVVLHPDKPAFKGEPSWADALLEAPALSGLAVLDLRQAYRARGARWQDIAVDPIGHLNPAGHRLAASILEGKLREDGPASQEPRPIR